MLASSVELFPGLIRLLQNAVYLVVVSSMEHECDRLLAERPDLSILFHRVIFRLSGAVVRVLLAGSGGVDTLVIVRFSLSVNWLLGV